jgi:hypothetical protein
MSYGADTKTKTDKLSSAGRIQRECSSLFQWRADERTQICPLLKINPARHAEPQARSSVASTFLVSWNFVPFMSFP